MIDLSTIPITYDVIWCKFPYANSDEPGLKERPGLVRSVARSERGDIALDVAYGTTKCQKAYANNLFVTQPNDVIAAGLTYPTRFDLNLVKRIPWNEDWVSVRYDGKGPIVGHISPETKRYLDLLLANWQGPRPR